jgi:hypothetical protein
MSEVSARVNEKFNFPFRDVIQKARLLTIVRNLRAIVRGDLKKWVRNGCPSPAPNVVKMAVVRHYVETTGFRYFVETGTFMGSMVEHIAETGVQCMTIEIDEELYRRATNILSRRRNIECLKGDSAKILPEILSRIKDPAVFWLDAHYSGGFTGKTDVDTPVSAELDMILNHPAKGHVILIDDARDFVGTNGYPHLSSVFAYFDNHPDYRMEVSADVIRITPRSFIKR